MANLSVATPNAPSELKPITLVLIIFILNTPLKAACVGNPSENHRFLLLFAAFVNSPRLE
jgi:hypothetical protein